MGICEYDVIRNYCNDSSAGLPPKPKPVPRSKYLVLCEIHRNVVSEVLMHANTTKALTALMTLTTLR